MISVVAKSAVSLHRHKPWNPLRKSGFRPARSLLGYFQDRREFVQEDYGKFSVDGLDHRRNFLLIKTLKERAELRQRTSWVTNFAGI